jgi:hypothetical protein
VAELRPRAEFRSHKHHDHLASPDLDHFILINVPFIRIFLMNVPFIRAAR